MPNWVRLEKIEQTRATKDMIAFAAGTADRKRMRLCEDRQGALPGCQTGDGKAMIEPNVEIAVAGLFPAERRALLAFGRAHYPEFVDEHGGFALRPVSYQYTVCGSYTLAQAPGSLSRLFPPGSDLAAHEAELRRRSDGAMAGALIWRDEANDRRVLLEVFVFGDAELRRWEDNWRVDAV